MDLTEQHGQEQATGVCPINKALRLLIDCQRLYKSTDAHGKRLANQTFTTGIDINEDEEATLRLAEPFAVTTGQNTHVGGSTTSEFADQAGPNPNAQRCLERLSSAWEQAKRGIASERTPVSEPEPRVVSNPTRRSRTPLTSREVDAIRIARANGESVLSIAKRFDVRRVTVWEKTKAM